MQEASMSLQSIAVLLPYKETPITNAQLHRFSRLPTTPKSAGLRWAQRRLVVTNGGPQGQEPSREIKLDKQDLMAIEFGRLLGEPKEKTISKVLRRKIDSASTYIGLEREANTGKELINKADFALKVERPSRASRNGSMLGPDIPHLASPPLRQNGSRVNLPKSGANADAHEILDDSLLRKPISGQPSKAVSPIMSSKSLATDIVKRPESQRMTAVEQSNVNFETLRSPSLDKGQDDGKASLSSGTDSKENYLHSPSQSLPPGVANSPKDTDSMEASKLEFQRLLDKAFITSALPNLVSPPSRHRGTVGTFVQPAHARNKATQSFEKSLASEAESLLRKPGVQASPGFPLSSAQFNDDQSFMPPKANSQPDLNEASASPRLAAPPSRHTGTMGTFVQPSRAKIRGIPSQSKEPIDNTIDETLLRKPPVLEKSTISMISTPPTEASTKPLSINKQTQVKGETLDANSLARPLMEAVTSQMDDKRGYQIDGLEQGVSERTFQLSPQLEMPLVDQKNASDNRSDFENLLQVSYGSNGKNEAVDLVSGQQSEQSNNELHTNDDQSFMPPKANHQPAMNEASASPHLVAPPSRHPGRMGTFVQPSRAKIRGTPLQSKEPVDNSIDESILRKPPVLEKSTISMVSTLPTEASTGPLSMNKQTQLKGETLDANILPRPLMEAVTSRIDERGYQVDGLEQDVSEKAFQSSPQSEVPLNVRRSDFENLLQVSIGSNGENEALDLSSGQQSEPVSEVESSAQSSKQLAEPRASDGLVELGKVSNRLSRVVESGGSQDVSNSSGAKSVKVAALKKPVRVSSSNPGEGLASEGKSLPDSLQGLIVNPDVIQQASSLSAGEEDTLTSQLDSNKDSRKVEENVRSLPILKQLIGTANNVSGLAPDEASLGDQQRDQKMVQELLIAAPGSKQTKVSHDGTPFVIVPADKEAENGSFLLPSTDKLRRPSQHAHAEFSTQLSEHMDLQASHPKLHQAKEEEEKDWARAEAMLKAKEQVEIKMIGSNAAGLFVSFGCLVGFLPSFELSPKRGLVDFGSWAQQKGYDLSQKKAVKGANDGGQSGTLAQNIEGDKLSKASERDIKELKDKYKEEVSKLLSSFVGEKTKVIVKLVDKGGRKLKVSEKEADPGSREHLQKKANLMAELKLGDVVTCQVKSITPIGVFVEVDGVPALIHHSEVSWNARTNPASLLTIGEVIKAKVCRLDRTLQRINLSLKQMQLDPLKRTLESVVGDLDTSGPMQAFEASELMEMNWPELGDLIKKLEQLDNISCVSRGRCLHSAAFAPSFQVLISTPQRNGYKLLARFENKIQEILVDTTLDSDKMKECIRLCTFSQA